MPEASLSIGQVAKRAKTSVSAIRYYERQGLLPRAERSGGQRRFTDEAVRRLAVIDLAKRGGLSLAEIRELLASIEEGTPAHEPLQAIAARKLPEVDELIERASRAREWLTLATVCGCRSLEDCALFGAGPAAP